jgi:hypothetical protein
MKDINDLLDISYRHITVLSFALILFFTGMKAQQKYKVGKIDMTQVDYQYFLHPNNEFRGVKFVDLDLNHETPKSIAKKVTDAYHAHKWGSFILIPGGGSTKGLSNDYLKYSGRKLKTSGIAYLSDYFFKIYEDAIKTGLKLGFRLSTLYDEWNYPSGTAGGLFYSRYPNDCAKTLEMVEQDASNSNCHIVLTMPKDGIYIGSVAMNMKTYQRIDISNNLHNDKLNYNAPDRQWKVMLFYLSKAFLPANSKGGTVDYLDKDAVKKYIDLNFGAYYKHIGKYFGSVIERTFFDEPTMMNDDGRMWTPKFNKGFEKCYGYDPMTLYPALYYNIGNETASARNALYRYRADLFGKNYIGQVSSWVEAHGLKCGGHLDQEESRNPVGANGDMMEVFKYQSIPATDDIYYPGRSNVGYKIVSSSCYNWDKPEMFTETFAAYGRPQYNALTPDNYMRVSLDQLAMGTNIQIEFGRKFYGVDSILGRSGYMLRGGRHVADIAIVYPIASLMSAYTMPNGNVDGHYFAYMGGIIPPETDYMDIGESFYRGLHIDYTYLHPDVLIEKCTINGNRLKLNNANNWEEYRILILPGGDTLSADVAKKVLDFYQHGGIVIATSRLPIYSAEKGRDQEVKNMVYEVFGISDDEPMTCKVRHAQYRFMNIFYKSNKVGGKSYFLPKPYTSVLEEIIGENIKVRDVDLQIKPDYYVKTDRDYNGAVTYIHKVRDSKDIYFFANTTDQLLQTTVRVRGCKKLLEFWNPHTGSRKYVNSQIKIIGGETVTEFPLTLPKLHSMFVVNK